MSESLTKLRKAIRREWDMATKHGRCICATCDEAAEDVHAALAAVEQEMVAKDAERDELRKLPTHKEVTRAIWQDAPMGLDGNGVRIEVARNVDKLFDAKAAQ